MSKLFLILVLTFLIQDTFGKCSNILKKIRSSYVKLFNENKDENLWYLKYDSDTISPIVKFYLYTHKNRFHPQRIELNNVTSILYSNFNPSNPTKFLISDFMFNAGRTIIKLKNSYVRTKNINVFVVSWNSGDNPNDYLSVRLQVKPVSLIVAKFLDFMLISGDMSSYLLSIIGHGVGAHIAGISGRHMKSSQARTIIGLDPAKTLFSYNNPNDRICKGDGEYVEIIHTNDGHFGMIEHIGDTDFIVNGGVKQPVCKNNDNLCSHMMAPIYFAESINTKIGFVGRNFGNQTSMMGGEPSNAGKSLTGVYYINTNHLPPFAKGYNF